MVNGETVAENFVSVATIQHLARYPVKSMKGEVLSESTVGGSGLRGDRVRVLVDVHSGKQVTARQVPGLLAYEASWEECQAHSGSGLVRVRNPEGRIYDWDDGELLSELQKQSGRDLAWQVYEEGADLTGVDDSPLLLITESTLREAARQWKAEEGFWRRFRPNVVVKGTAGTPFEENGWIGSRLRLGSAVLEVMKGCERCMMVTLSPDDRSADPSLLRMILEQWGGCLGVYARVVESGFVRLGDTVEIGGDGE